tara:strand:- start:14322 stop:15560 length:1239 start_codon:yes stop_codon:yes gene_type:complete
MYRIFDQIFLPLMIIKLVVAANNFKIYFIDLGFLLFISSIFLALLVLVQTQYAFTGLILFLLSFALYFLEFFSGGLAVSTLKTIFLDLLFLLAGAKVFLTNPGLIPRQLYFFFFLCIPVMLLQITGASSFFMFWNTDYLHSPEILSPEELGTFKIIEVYPTLFRSSEELYLMIGQGRPSGLLHANNLLSYLICIGIALNAAFNEKKSYLSSQDYILAAISVLSMSLTVSVIYLISVIYLLSENFAKAAKLLFAYSFMLLIYYLFFPGIVENFFSETTLFSKIFSRFYELAYSIGFYDFFTLTYDSASNIDYSFDPSQGSYNLITIIISNNLVFPILFLLILFAVAFFFSFARNRNSIIQIISLKGISFLIAVSLIVQVSIPFILDIFGMFLFGFVLSPFLVDSFKNEKRQIA